MKILVSNDDGIYADGLKALVNSMKKLGEVVVVAPAEHQSGAGHSITFNGIVKVEKIQYDQDTIGYKVFGRPRDCVEIGLADIVKDVDLVVTGINDGCNLSSDCVCSGTCGAACGALAFHVPAIAFSLEFGNKLDLSYCGQVAYKIADWFIKQPFNKDFILNVNIPNTEEENIKGTTVAGFGGYPTYHNDLTPTFDGKYYYYNTRSTDVTFNYTDESINGDLYAIDHDYITLTPLHLNMVKEDSLPLLRKMWKNQN